VGSTILVTDNYTDFSSKHARNLDDDLIAELPTTSKWCYHSLETFRVKHLQGILLGGLFHGSQLLAHLAHYFLDALALAVFV
jgi:hypothetical protein